MDSRRNFLGKVATGLAGTLAAGPAEVLGAADRIRVGVIGAGDRGMELVSQIRACPNTEIAAFADVYYAATGTRPGRGSRLGRLHGLSPPAGGRLDGRGGDRDAAASSRRAILGRSRRGQARVSRKDHGVHGGSRQADARGVSEIRVEAHGPDRPSGLLLRPHERRAAVLADPDRMGKITAIDMQMYRNTPHGNKPQWSRPALLTPDLTAQNIAWEDFLGEAPARAFDAHRFMHWRYFWENSGGNVFENMSHQLSFWYKALDLQIPRPRRWTAASICGRTAAKFPTP